MPWTILRTSLVNAMFGGAFFLYFVFGTGYMKAVGFTGDEPEIDRPDRRGLHAGVHDRRLVPRRLDQPADDPADRRRRVPGFRHPVFLSGQHRQLLSSPPIAEIIGFGFVFGFGYGAIPTFYTENFPTRYRASGASAAYQIAQVYGGGLIPIVAGQILRVYGVKDAYRVYRRFGDVLRGGGDRRHSAHAGDQERQSRELTGAPISIVC